IEYGNYPKEYQEIIKDFYSDIVESNKLEIINISYPKEYFQTKYQLAFSTKFDLKNKPYSKFGEELSGYLICVGQTNHYDGYKVDGVLIKNNRVISRISNLSKNNIYGNKKLCEKEVKEMQRYAYDKAKEEQDKKFNALLRKIKKHKKTSYNPRRSYGSSCDCGYGYCYGPRGGRYCITSGGNKSYR
ncbi:TPA: hypothetical protein QB235_002134, partial [Pasteurella multocida]|nr:hypothetical protein [Pasteurella multocida]